jgi:hypothetical protein
MVVFILAAAGAYLLCTESFVSRLKKNADELRSVLFMLLAVAVLVILVAVTTSPRWFGTILLGLAVLLAIGVEGGLLFVLGPQLKPLLPESFLSWLKENADPLRSALLTFLLLVVLVILVAVTATPHWSGIILLGLAVLLAIGVVGGLLFVLGRQLKLLLPKNIAWLRLPILIPILISVAILILIFQVLLAMPFEVGVDFVGCRPGPTAIAIFSCKSDAWAYAILLTTRRIASMPETVHAVLGVVAGLMCGNFPRWMTYARSLGTTGSRGSTWPTIIFAAALSSVVLAALVAPYAPATLGRVSGLETPYVKVQFAISPSPAEKQEVLKIERDLNNLDTLEAFARSLRFIQYDCAQAALDARETAGFKGIAEVIRNQPKYRVFTAGLAFRKSLIPYVNRIVNAQRKGYNLVVLKARVRQVAEKFALLATNGDFEKNYQAAMSEVHRQHQLFRDEGVGDDPLLEEVERQNIDRDPAYCWSSAPETSLTSYIFDITDTSLTSYRSDINNVRNTRMVVQEKPPLVHGFAAALFLFEDSVEAANAMFISAFQSDQKTEDINTIGEFANALYVGGRDLREVLPWQEKELRIIESRIGPVERAEVWSQDEVKADLTGARETDNKIRDDLVKRYSRARFQLRLRLAYLWAQHGLASEEDLLPQRDLHWSSAQKYADEAYESILDKSKRPPHIECTDRALDLRIKDTYAFVKLAYQAYNLKTLRMPPEEFQVRQARGILEEAMTEARDAHRRVEEADREAHPRVEEARSPMVAIWAAPSCFTEVETKAWIKRISSHLRLAEALRP